jgi:hypothetical protein
MILRTVACVHWAGTLGRFGVYVDCVVMLWPAQQFSDGPLTNAESVSDGLGLACRIGRGLLWL